MVKRILVPIAFSKYSKGILDYAADLALATGAELIVVNVINERDLEAVDKITSFGYKVDIEHYVDTIKKERGAELTKMLESLTLADDKVTYTFCLGEPTNELLKMVIDREVDMVVMGVKNNDLRHIFTGSVAERMFRKCPVTIVSHRDDEISDRLRKRFERHRDTDD
jgi:nucleotide-binding universal stress UspA family protein